MMTMQLPLRQRAAVLKRQGKAPLFEIEDIPLPEPGPTDLLVRLSATGICGTDLALASGELGPACRILGHEGIGRVVKRGSSLTESDVPLGQRVGISWVRDTCRSCAMCLRDGGETRCVAQIHSGRRVDGTFAEFTVVPFRYMIRLPEGPSDEELAPIMCGGVTAYKVLKICGAPPGQWIVISGAGGGLGALGIQYGRAMGYRVLAIDSGSQKREYCLGLQAEAYLDVSKENDISAAVKRLTGGQGASAVLVTAGSAQAYQDALDMLAPFGTLVCVGIPPPSQSVHFHPLALIDRGFRIVGSMVGSRGDIQEAVDFVRRREVIHRVHLTTLDRIMEIANPHASTNQVIGKFVIKLDC